MWLVNAKDVKHLPSGPKTDRLDAVWLCKVAERQMIRPRETLIFSGGRGGAWIVFVDFEMMGRA